MRGHLRQQYTRGVTPSHLWEKADFPFCCPALCVLQSVLQLTNLRKLSILGPSGLQDGRLKALTALQRLEELDLSICEFSGEMFQAIMERGSVRDSPGEQTLWRLSSGVSNGSGGCFGCGWHHGCAEAVYGGCRKLCAMLRQVQGLYGF